MIAHLLFASFMVCKYLCARVCIKTWVLDALKLVAVRVKISGSPR